MGRKKLPYREGDWFAVPLGDGHYALGIAARVAGNGGVIGYFFGPRYDHIPVAEEIQDLSPAQAVLVANFGDLGLIKGQWPVIFRPADWNKEEWPMPIFGRVHPITGRGFRTLYSESDLATPVWEERIPADEARQLPEDSAWGYQAVEIHLARTLD